MSARQRLAEILGVVGMSQAELARRLGEHPNWVNNRVRGIVDLKADDIPRIAHVLGVRPTDFFEDPGPPRKAGGRGFASDAASPDRLAQLLQDEMSDADLEFIESLIRFIRHYRERLRTESSSSIPDSSDTSG